MDFSSNYIDLDLEDIPDYYQWHVMNGPGFSLQAYAYHLFSPDLAIAAAALFWPTFIQYTDGLFLADGFTEEGFFRWKDHFGEDIRAIERACNHRHLCDMFRLPRSFSKKNLLYLGNTLLQSWRCAMFSQFPRYNCCVVGDWVLDGNELEITCYHL